MAKRPKARKQVAALPIKLDEAGAIRVLLITSRETRRFVIPKGWPMKGRRDYEAAALEAEQEAGVVGRVHKDPIGTYDYWKRQANHFQLCRVKVFALAVDEQLADWREKGQREVAWLTVSQAAALVDEPGLIAILRTLPEMVGGAS